MSYICNPGPMINNFILLVKATKLKLSLLHKNNQRLVGCFESDSDSQEPAEIRIQKDRLEDEELILHCTAIQSS